MLSAQDDAPRFGMRLRRPPASPAETRAPVVLHEAPENEATLIRLKDNRLRIYFLSHPGGKELRSITSQDDGVTWEPPAMEFPVPQPGGHYGVQVLQEPDGAIQAVVHAWRGTGRKPGLDRNLDLWHAVQKGGQWSEPKRIFEGYVGSMRGFTQMQSGRLVLPFARAVPERFAAPVAGETDLGWHNTVVLVSDDHGQDWRRSPDELTVTLATPNNTRYGAIEPHVVQLKDGRVWMLIRDRCGRLYESFSPDGWRWPAATPSAFISSDSPATTARLNDGRLVLFWNACQRWDNPRSYAMGGREVLHAAVSADEGRSWQGFREVLHEPDIPVLRGDRGAAYPSAVQAGDGKVVLVSGQGAGRKAIVRMDPDWLVETRAEDDFAGGLAQWTFHGMPASRYALKEEGGARHLALAWQPMPAPEIQPNPRRPAAPISSASAAVWNFPAGRSGALRARVRLPSGSQGGSFALTDHFSVAVDEQAAAHAIHLVQVVPESAASSAGTLAVPLQKWVDLEIAWQAEGGAEVKLDGRLVMSVKATRAASFGLNYLRVNATAADGVNPGVEIQKVSVEVTPPAPR